VPEFPSRPSVLLNISHMWSQAPTLAVVFRGFEKCDKCIILCHTIFLCFRVKHVPSVWCICSIQNVCLVPELRLTVIASWRRLAVCVFRLHAALEWRRSCLRYSLFVHMSSFVFIFPAYPSSLKCTTVTSCSRIHNRAPLFALQSEFVRLHPPRIPEFFKMYHGHFLFSYP
jgi:hypothetical protein